MIFTCLGEEENKVQTFLKKVFIGSENMAWVCVVTEFAAEHPAACVTVHLRVSMSMQCFPTLIKGNSVY